MADTDSYDSSINSSLASQNASAIDKMAEAQKSAESQGAAGAKQNPAGMIHGGKDLISKDSMKGKALSEDPQANLASKRSSEYRKVFQARGAAGKHSWGT